MGLLARGQAMLARHLAEAAGEAVTYSRGLRAATLTAWAGRRRTDTRGPDPTGAARIDFEQVDWLVEAAGLDFGDGETEPRKGDRITTAAGDCFEALPTADGACWDWSDANTRTVYRVHTKPVAPDDCHP